MCLVEGRGLVFLLSCELIPEMPRGIGERFEGELF